MICDVVDSWILQKNCRSSCSEVKDTLVSLRALEQISTKTKPLQTTKTKIHISTAVRQFESNSNAFYYSLSQVKWIIGWNACWVLFYEWVETILMLGWCIVIKKNVCVTVSLFYWLSFGFLFQSIPMFSWQVKLYGSRKKEM